MAPVETIKKQPSQNVNIYAQNHNIYENNQGDCVNNENIDVFDRFDSNEHQNNKLIDYPEESDSFMEIQVDHRKTLNGRPESGNRFSELANQSRFKIKKPNNDDNIYNVNPEYKDRSLIKNS